MRVNDSLYRLFAWLGLIFASIDRLARAQLGANRAHTLTYNGLDSDILNDDLFGLSAWLNVHIY